MDLDKVRGTNFSAILTSPVAEERRKEGRHDVIVVYVRAVIRRDDTIDERINDHIF